MRSLSIWAKIATISFSLPVVAGAIGGVKAWNSKYEINASETYCIFSGEDVPCSVEILRFSETISSTIIGALIGLAIAIIIALIIAMKADLARKTRPDKTGKSGR